MAQAISVRVLSPGTTFPHYVRKNTTSFKHTHETEAMSEPHTTAEKANIGSFETINTQLLKARQALQMQSRISNMLAEIDQDLLRKRAELSKAVTDLKWKTYALDESRKGSAASFFYGILGRRKEWQTAVQHAYDLSLSHYERCKNKITLLESEREALDQRLNTLANSQEGYLAAKQQQLDFIISFYSGKAVVQLETISNRLKQTQADSKRMKTALRVGRDASTQLQTFIKRLESPFTWGEDALMHTDEIWLLPMELLAEQSVVAKLSAYARSVQEILDDFQRKLANVSWQFWPTLSVLKPNTRYSSVEQLTKWWLYDVQQTRSRLEEKLAQLEQVVEGFQRTVNRLEAEQDRLVAAIWKKENFPKI